MIGDVIAKVRKERKMSKTELARLTDINIGHLTHIEKGERNPSHKALKKICKALDVPYQQIMYTYEKTLNEEQEAYGLVNHIGYDKVLAVDNIASFIHCPSEFAGSSVAIKLPDDSMNASYEKENYVFVEFNTPLNNKEIGLFSLNGEILVRKFYLKRGKITLKADNKKCADITVKDGDTFYLIGKVLGQA